MKHNLQISALALALLASPASAATVNYVGTEVGGIANGYVVENWSNTGVAKAYDIGGSERYGTAGYAQLLPMTPYNTTAQIYQAAPGAWDGFGSATASDNSTVSSVTSQPTFTANFLGYGGPSYAYVNFPGYSVFTATDGVSLVREGGVSVPTLNLVANGTPSGDGYWGNAAYFDLNQTATFRVGIVVDAVGDGTYSADYVSIYSVNGTFTTFSSLLTRDANPDMVFFDITGNFGEQFAIGLWQKTGAGYSTAAGYSLVTFDVIPEPATWGLLTAGLCTAIFLRRRRTV